MLQSVAGTIVSRATSLIVRNAERVTRPSFRQKIPPSANMSSEATTSKPEDSAKQTSEIQKEGDQTPHLSVLEEDDEFEEFAVQGEQQLPTTTHEKKKLRTATRIAGNAVSFSSALAETYPRAISDWDDSQTDLAHLGSVAPGAAKSEGDKLWEDNWDDDDIEEEFSVQLR